mgnify:FL=1
MSASRRDGVVRIVSGGQTGADRGGLDAARVLGLDQGGWCPRGRRAEDGRIPDRYQLAELSTPTYLERTRRNVVDSDATILFTRGEPRGGSRLTAQFAREAGRPLLHIDVRDLDTQPQASCDRLRAWLARHEVAVLNVAGSRESGCPGIAATVERFLVDCLAGAAALPLVAEPTRAWEDQD